MTKLRQVCAAVALAATASGSALADVSANIGYMSDYIFRGAYQAESVAFGGLDASTDNGFYLGMWGANLKDGLEYDIYAGYEGGGEDFTWYAGATGYYYTDDFDSTYLEYNLGISFGFMSLDYALGDYDVGAMTAGIPGAERTQTYQYVGATFAPEVGPYYFIGRTDYKNIDVGGMGPGTGRLPATGADGYWLEIGKSFELMEDLELNIAALFSGDVPQSTSTTPSTIQLAPSSAADSEYALTFTLTKNISIGD
jgi:hypothetical protein